MFHTIGYKTGYIHIGYANKKETILAVLTTINEGYIFNHKCECKSLTSAKRWITLTIHRNSVT